MRLWSIHPKYLDSKGLVALWRESLLAQKVLLGKTKSYRNHPQLERFKKQLDSVSAISSYLNCIYEEGKKRGHNFRKEKILNSDKKSFPIKVADGQILFEFEYLKKKLKKRNLKKYRELLKIKKIEPHPIFEIVKGKIETWEKSSLK